MQLAQQQSQISLQDSAIAALTAAIITLSRYTGRRLLHRHDVREAAGYAYCEGDVVWDSKTVVRLPLGCVFAGVLSGMLGVGGGMVMSPLMLELGMLPDVTAATLAAAAISSERKLNLGGDTPSPKKMGEGFEDRGDGSYCIGRWTRRWRDDPTTAYRDGRLAYPPMTTEMHRADRAMEAWAEACLAAEAKARYEKRDEEREIKEEHVGVANAKNRA